jgi:hypothetical protein
MYRHCVRAVLLLGITLPALIPGSAQAAVSLPRVCVYADAPHAPLYTGHAFVQLLPDRGPQAGNRNLVYGFAPKESWRFLGGPGEVSSNATHHWDYKICYAVPPVQYDRMEARVAADIRNPPSYALFTFNCTDWVLRVAAAGAITVPPAKPGRVPGVTDPDRLAESIKSIAAGRQFAGGVPRRNPGNAAPNGGVDPVFGELDVDSYDGLVEFALADPQRLAAGVHLDNHEEHLSTRTIGHNHELSLNFENVRRHDAIIAVDWGDGAKTYQEPTATHRYERAGSHHVRAVVVRNATLFRVTLTVNVVSAGGNEEIALQTPHDGRQPDFPPLAAPIVPLPL